MARMQTGYVYQDKDGRWYCRYDYKDESGKWRTVRRRAENKSKAKGLLDKLLREYKEGGQQALDGDRMSFNDLADYYEATYIQPPEYVDGRKISGLRDYVNARHLLKVLRGGFGTRRLKSITYGDIERFRAARLKTPTLHKRQRSIATVNRELSMLRRVLNVAVRNGWLLRSPIIGSKSLIAPGDEKPRQRILTREEERRLLDACIAQRAYLRPIIIMAIDTGMRRGEILKLKWADVDFSSHIIMVCAFNTKTMRERQVAMTERIKFELQWLYDEVPKEPGDLVFGITGSIKKAFNTATRKAKIHDLHFHDLRSTAATRMVQGNIPLPEVGRVLGHTQPQTTYRFYVNANVETARRAAAVLDAFNNVEAVREIEIPLVH
jgi:integrase